MALLRSWRGGTERGALGQRALPTKDISHIAAGEDARAPLSCLFVLVGRVQAQVQQACEGDVRGEEEQREEHGIDDDFFVGDGSHGQHEHVAGDAERIDQNVPGVPAEKPANVNSEAHQS